MNVRSAGYNIQDLVELRRQELKEKKGNLIYLNFIKACNNFRCSN